MIDIIIMTIGMLAFVALGFLINHCATQLWWVIYQWKLSREDDRMLEEQATEEESDNVLNFKRDK